MARKKVQKNGDEPQNVGLDIGYGKIKVAHAGVSFTFPSVAGLARNVRFGSESNASRFPNEQIEHDGNSWWVGNFASEQLSASEQRRLRGRSSNADENGMNFRVLMMKSALAKLAPETKNGDVLHYRIVTGLPVNHMAQAGALKKALIGKHPVHTDSTNFIANIVDVAVMPEPRGTMFAFTLNPDGSLNDEYSADTTVIFNGGAVTNDVQYDKNGEFIDTYSGSSRTGHHLALERLQTMMEERYGETPDLSVLEAILINKAIKIQGDLVPFGDEVAEALEPVRTGALQLLADTVNTALTVDSIIVSGGFALSSYKSVGDIYPQSVKSANPLFDTAQGYYNYSMFKTW